MHPTKVAHSPLAARKRAQVRSGDQAANLGAGASSKSTGLHRALTELSHFFPASSEGGVVVDVSVVCFVALDLLIVFVTQRTGATATQCFVGGCGRDFYPGRLGRLNVKAPRNQLSLQYSNQRTV